MPNVLYPKLKECLNRLIKNKIIEKVDNPVDWIHNLVVTEKANGSLRLCLDQKELNEVTVPELYHTPTFEEITSKLFGKHYFTILDCKEGFY